MDTNKMTSPAPPTHEKSPSDLWTTTTTTVDGGSETPSFWARNMDLIVWVAIATYAATGVLIGLIIVMAFPFWMQVAAMVSYVVIGCLGWLPWQRVRGIE